MKISHGIETSQFDLIVDVVPEGALPFRVETREWFGIVNSPSAGDKLRVRCNPEHRMVEFDLSEDVRFNPKLREAAKKAELQMERQLNLEAAPGTPPASPYLPPPDTAMAGGAYLDPELAELMRLEEQERLGDQ